MILEDILGGGSNSLGYVNGEDLEIIETSGNFTAPTSGKYLVILSGGGGGGGACGGSGYALAIGGNSGDMKALEVTLSAGEIVPVTIGAGGTGETIFNAGNAGDGGVSSFGSYLSTLNVANGGKSGTGSLYPNKTGFKMSDAIPAVNSYLAQAQRNNIVSVINGGTTAENYSNQAPTLSTAYTFTGGASSLICSGSLNAKLGTGGSCRYNGSGYAGASGFCIVLKKGIE